MTDIITDHEQEFANFEAQRTERFLERARQKSTILNLQGSGILQDGPNNTGWVPGGEGKDPDSDPDISPPNAARGRGTGNELDDILSQLDRLQKLIGGILSSYVEKAKVNRQGSTKPTAFPEQNAGKHNPFADTRSDEVRLADATWKHRRAWNESEAEFQRRLQDTIAELTQQHRQLRTR
jgi:hypothetical protein